MLFLLSCLRRFAFSLPPVAALLIASATAFGQDNPSTKGKDLYDRIKAFTLSGPVPVKELGLKRDRAQMVFNGTFYFAAAVDGHVTGAVFIGEGRFMAEAPPNEFEKNNLKRLLGTEVVESDFKTAVFRFSDDTFEQINVKAGTGGGDQQAQKLAGEIDARILKQIGANLPARIALTILNQEKPGFFFATFDGGKRGRFNLLLDYQGRIPVANFDINAGEKGLIFNYRSEEIYNEVWMAFYGPEDYQRGTVEYSDVNDLIDVTHYDMAVNLADYKKETTITARVAGTITQENAPDDWIMPLPVLISFGKNQEARGIVMAHGPKEPFQIRLPARPQKVELDPHHWVLSDKTSTK